MANLFLGLSNGLDYLSNQYKSKVLQGFNVIIFQVKLFDL